jgi:hypothetical protein
MIAAVWPSGRSAALLAIAALGCGSGRKSPHAAAPEDAAAPADAAPVELTRGPLGAAALPALGWRSRPGHDAYRKALVAERAGAWKDVVDACRQARAIDPDHLEAAWLEAAALARQGLHDQVLAPLQVAASGDWGKWGERSLELDLFAAFRASPAGVAWTRAAEDYRADYLAALDRALVVGAGGDLYAYDPRDQRWLRVTRTNGAVRAAVRLEPAHLIAFVAVRKAAGGGSGKAVTVGVVDLSTGRPAGEVKLAGDTVKVRFRDAKGVPALEVADRKPGAWDRVDWRAKTRAPSDAKGAVLSPTLVVAGDKARLVRAPTKDVTADWDDQGVAGAIRIERTRRTVTAPGTTLFDGNTLAWSRDRARLAMMTAPAEPCAAEDREAVVIDVDTGRLRSIDRGGAPAQVAWLAAGEIAVARDGTVGLYAADGTQLATLAVPDTPLWLWTRPQRPACDGEPEPEPEPVPVPEPDPDTEPGTETAVTVPPDGGTAQPATRDAGTTPPSPPDANR